LVGGSANNNIIGGSNANPNQPSTDIISGNTGNGVTLATGTNNIQVINNWIGLNRFGLPNLPNSGDAIVVNGSSNDTIAGNIISCFAAGTLITTERGEIAVEQLHIGDRVRTLRREGWASVTWIGQRRISCRRHPAPRKVHPVRIAAGAFGPGLPTRDLFLSPDHAVFIDDVLIPVKYLLDGHAIAQIAVDQVTYYHIELPQHDVLQAEGLPAESYLDTGNRTQFGNGGQVQLFADFDTTQTADIAAVWEAKGCAPFVVEGAAIDAIRRRLAAAQRRVAARRLAADAGTGAALASAVSAACGCKARCATISCQSRRMLRIVASATIQ
jgi:hypothetical protein